MYDYERNEYDLLYVVLSNVMVMAMRITVNAVAIGGAHPRYP